MSEAGKRKKDSGGNDGSSIQKKAREEEENGVKTAVTDAEVDEFFAIIKRTQEAVKYLKDGNDHVRNLMDLEEPSELETGHQADGDGEKSKASKNVASMEVENTGFDLNADPEPDGDPA